MTPKKTRRSVLSLMLAFSMLLGFCLPVGAAEGGQEPIYDTYVSTGDNLWVADTPPMDTPAAIDAMLDMFEDFGYRRIYWRGLQQSLWNQVMETRDEAVRYVGAIEGIRALYDGFNPDKYFVQEAHKRGMEVWGVSTLQDWGGAGDTPINFYPAHYEADFRVANPDWAPKDKYGLMEQGGTVDFAYPEARQTLIDLHVNEIEEVDYDGVLFITYSENFSLKFDDQFGYSQPTIDEFYRRYGITAGKEPFNRWASIYDWRKLRGEYLTAFLRELKADLGDKGIGLFLDPRNPYHMQAWQYETVISNAIYLDLETWVREGIVDQFLVAGASGLESQLSTLRNILWMVRGTNTDVAIYTSGPTGAHWKEFQDQGVATVTQVGGFGEELYYQRSQLVRSTAHTQKMSWLSQVVGGTQSATLAQLTPYLSDESLSVRRLAIKALGKVNPAGAASYVEAMLEDPEPGVRGQAAVTLRTVGGPGSAAALLAAVDAHDEWTLFEAAAVTMGVTFASSKTALVTAYQNSENPRVRAAAMRALSYGASPEMLTMFTEAVQTEFAPDGSPRTDVVQYNAIRYYATESIGRLTNNSAAVDALLDILEGEDTVASNRAVLSLGDMARRNDAVLGTRRADIVETLDALLGKMGEDSVRADRDWAYRPIGESLLALGSTGKTVLQNYMNQREDARLAEFAWKSLYLPQTLQAYTPMTEKEYDEAYLMLPDILKDFNVTRLSQNFDNTSVFTAPFPAGNGWAGDNTTSVGRWGIFGSGGVTLDQTIYHSAGQSAKLVRGGNLFYGILATGLKERESYRLSFWTYREAGGSYVFQTANASGQAEIMGLVGADGKIMLYSPATSSYSLDTGLTIPAGQWVQLQAVAGRSTGKVRLIMTPENGEPQESAVTADFTVQTQVARVVFSPQGTAGTASYIDDVILAEASAAPRKIQETLSLSDRSTPYDGEPQGIIPQTSPAGIEVLVEYEGIGGTSYPRSETPPTDAGTYQVIAAITEPGYSGTAAATLTIRKAVPTPDPAGVSAGELEYGQSLGDSQLTGIFYGVDNEPLDGVFSWDEGNEQIPAVTGSHPYTFTPVSPNYERIRGTAQVAVDLQWVGWITRIDQDFDDTGVFAPTTTDWVGDNGTTAGRWGVFYEWGPLVSTDQSYSGTQSVKLIRKNATEGSPEVNTQLQAVTNPAMAIDADYELSLMLYRNSGMSFVMTTHGGSSSSPEAALIVAATGAISLYNHGATPKAYNIPTGLTIPAETWTKLTLSVSRSEGHFTVSLTSPEGMVSSSTNTAPLPATAIATKQIFINPQNPAGVVGYIDDVLLREKTTVPQTAAVTLTDQAVDYDGQPHGLITSTNPGDLAITAYYTGINGTDYSKSTEAPTDAGTYRVTALVTEDGWAGTAAATLTIRKAQPTVSFVTVDTDTLDFGQTLGEAGLTGEFLDLSGQPLQGSLTWDEGDSHSPLVTGERPYTFTPDNPSYAAVHGKLAITVIPLPGVYVITATASAGGGIDPSGEVAVDEGENQAFTFAADSGYRLSSVTVDGSAQSLQGDSYTFENVTDNHTIHAAFEAIPDPGPGPDPSLSPSPAPAPSLTETGGIITAVITVKSSVLTSAEADALLSSAKEAEAKGKKAVLDIRLDLPDSAQSAQVTLPRAQFNAIAGETSADLRISAGIADLTFDSRAIVAVSGTAAPGDIQVSIRAVEPSSLTDEVRSRVGSRPVYDFSVTAGGAQVSDFNGGSAGIRIPYTPAAGEDLNAIVVCYIGGSGKLEVVTNGRYDAETGTVVFAVSHFSRYAVGYNKVRFNDVASGAWYEGVVSFIAARGITDGVGNGSFGPGMTLTRGQFITMLLRAYGISPDANPAGNFSDAGNTYYTGYIAAAKRLGVSDGAGDNRFEPERAITRQEMFKLLYGALRAIDKLPQGSSGKTLSDFTDAGQLESWAVESMTYLVRTGVVGGNAGRLTPASTATRAEMAQVLYNLLGR